MSKKLISVFLCKAMVAALLTGCGAKDSTKTEDTAANSGNSTKDTAASGQEVTLT